MAQFVRKSKAAAEEPAKPKATTPAHSEAMQALADKTDQEIVEAHAELIEQGDLLDETLQADGTTELAVVGKDNQLEVSKVEALLHQFGQPFLEARQLAAGYNKLVVTDENDAAGMKKARDLRLQLRQVRINAENTRKQLKEDSLREGKAIDGMANIIKAIIVPAEQHLEQQEKFAETLAIERKATKKAERTAELSKYMDNVFIFNLEEMDDDQYAQVLEDAKAKHQAKLDAEKVAADAAEAQRKADEQAAEERRKKQAADLKEAQRKAKIAEDEKAKADAKAADEKARADAAQAKLDAAAKEKADEAAAAEKAAQDAAKAPDREKILMLATMLRNEFDEVSKPDVQSDNAKKIVENTYGLIGKVINYIESNVDAI